MCRTRMPKPKLLELNTSKLSVVRVPTATSPTVQNATCHMHRSQWLSLEWHRTEWEPIPDNLELKDGTELPFGVQKRAHERGSNIVRSAPRK